MEKVELFLKKKIFNYILFGLIWAFLILYAMLGKTMETVSIIFYLILYLPVTILILKRDFYYSHIIILMLSGIELMSNVMTVIKCIAGFDSKYILTLIINIIYFILFLTVIIFVYKKLKNNDETKNPNSVYNYWLIIVLSILRVVFLVINLMIYVNNNDVDVLRETVNVIHTIVLFIYQIVFILSSEKEEKLIKKEA